tara:strand:- start:2014 stop:3237 length:1224 start_codon:yes stop_codon:yes gene_type:complete
MILPKIELFIARVLIFDVIFLGPLGVRLWSGLTERHLILFFSISISLLYLIKNNTTRSSTFFLAIGFMLYAVIWGLFLPTIIQNDISSALSEIKPFLYLFFIPSAIRLLGSSKVEVVRRDLVRWSLILGLIIIFLWWKANFSMEFEYALAVKLAYTILAGGATDGIYIGPMPDGSFRIFWISCAIFPWSILLLKTSDKLWLIWAMLFLVAAYATGTRAVFYCAVMAFIYLIYINSPKFRLLNMGALIFALTAFVGIGISEIENLRIFDIQSEFEGQSARSIQAYALIASWQESIILGKGFGASADLVRSDTAAYSYELTYVALLMKVGLLGYVFMLIILSYFVRNFQSLTFVPRKQSSRAKIGLILFFLLTFTNPYLLTIHGLLLLIGLLLMWNRGNGFFKRKYVQN